MPRRRLTYDPITAGYVDQLNTVINSTISDSRLVLIAGPAADVFIIARVVEDDIFPLELPLGWWLHFIQLVHRIEDKVKVEEARYILSRSIDKDSEEDWIFRWGFIRQPEADHIPQSHLHVNGYSPFGSLKRIHFPTRQLSLEQVVAHIVQAYELPPKRSDWLGALRESHKGFLERVNDLEDFVFP